MPSNISFRIANVDDLDTVALLAWQVWPATYSSILTDEQIQYMMILFYSPASLKKQLLYQKHIFLIVEDGKEAVGFASYSGGDASGIYKLHKIYVLSNQQGKGLGKSIIDFIADTIRPQGATAIHLNVNRHNKARSFYEKLGFVVIGEEDNDIGNNYLMNDYVMELKL